MRLTNITKQLFAAILFITIFTNIIPAQTRRPARRPAPGQTAKVPVEKSKQACNGAWSGTITYTKTLDDTGSSDEPGIRKDKDRIIQQWSHRISYEGKMIVDGAGERPAAKAEVEFSDYRLQHGIEKVWDSCHAYNDEHWFIIDGKTDDTETASGTGDAQDFNLSVSEIAGSYGFSFTFPKLKGKFNHEDHTKRSGHCQPKNNEPYDNSTTRETNVSPEGYRVENQKIDPKNPDVLSGSIAVDKNDYSNPKSVKDFVYNVSWKFRRCSPPIVIKDVKLFQPLYPSPNSWNEVKESDHTVDGNQVKIVATLANLSGSSKTTYINFKELKENTDLKEGKIQVDFQPYQEREVTYFWDTSGYAWKEANIWNQPEIHRQVEVKIPDDVMTKNIQVNPKPVMLVPGLFSMKDAFSKFMGFFTSTANTEWKVDFAKVFVDKASAENAPILDKAVRDLQKRENAWHVDMVAHSTGGLIGRNYIHSQMPEQFDGRPTVTHFVMMGTPNMGTPCAWGTDKIFVRIFNRPADSMREITNANMKEFNQTVTDRKGTKFSILVGNAFDKTCQGDYVGDGITPSRSAIWLIKDWKFSTVAGRHENMMGEQANFVAISKWLTIPPKGNHAPDTSAMVYKPSDNSLAVNSGDAEENAIGQRRYGAMYRPVGFDVPAAADDDEPKNILATGVKIAPNQTAEIHIPVIDSSKMAVVLYAPADVSATLLDTAGNVAGKNLAGMPEAAGTFRTIYITRPVKAGTWKLRLENHGGLAAEVAVTAFAETSLLTLSFAAGEQNASKQVGLQAKLINNGTAVPGAKVVAKINSGNEIVLFDDGKHGDGAANDGTYGALTEKLIDGDYLVEVTAETSGLTVRTTGGFMVAPKK